MSPFSKVRAFALVGVLLATGGIHVLNSGQAAQAQPGSVTVSEDFSGTGLPAGWKPVEGTWTVENGRLVGTSANSGQLSRITFGTHLNDFRIEADVRFESVVDAARWTALGLDMPASGATPWWIATMRSGSTANNGLEFAQRTAANTWNVTNTASAPSAAGTGRNVHIAVEVHGGSARWIFDGREALRTSSLQRSSEGIQALVVNGSRVSFDNVTVTELAPNGYLRPAGSPMTIIAHRGASSAAPENTLVSDEIARRGGAEWIENDVQPSKDGVPFILHDSTVDRTTDGTGAIRNLTAAQLKQLDAGSWFAPMYTGTRMPTLAEQLADLRVRGGNMLLEIKGAHTRDEVAEIVRVIRAENMTQRVFVQSFEVDALRYTAELAPDLPLGLLRSALDADPVAISKELGLTSYNPNAGALLGRPGVVADLHEAGIAVMAWTVDSANQWQQLERIGTDAIITNRPAELSGWNAGFLQNQITPSVTVTSPADGATLDRAQAPTVAVSVTGATDTVVATVDGAPVEIGATLDLTALAAGAHTLRVEVRGPYGTASTTTEFTVEVSDASLAYLIFGSGADPHTVSELVKRLGKGDYLGVASYAEKQAEAGKLDAERAKLIAADARAL